MHRTAASNKHVDKFGAGKHGHRDRATSPLVPGTTIDADDVDSYQEEFANLLEAFDVELNDAGDDDYGQIAALITGLFRGTVADPDPEEVTIQVPLFSGLTSDWGISNYWISDGNTVLLFFDLSALIPDGATVTQVDFRVKPGASRSGTNRIALAFTRYIDPSSLSSVATGWDAGGTTSAHTVSFSGLSEVIDKTTREYRIEIASGNDGATNRDEIHWIRVKYKPNYPGRK